jgi:ubiquinone/menaquinone biosynthesis C-methylase UbiE
MPSHESDKVRDVWDGLAEGWHDYRTYMVEVTRPVHEWMVDALWAKPGDTVLELAAGPGDTGFLAAPQLGSSGLLISTDLAPSMVDTARRRAVELGISNVEHKVLDAQAMDLPDGSVDGVLCRWGFMLMPDPGAAFRECRRVLRPGGRLVFTVFTGGEENPWAALPAKLLVELGHLPKAEPGAPSILALGDRARLEELVDQAKFATRRIESGEMAWRFRTREEYWTWLLDVTALSPTLQALGDEARTQVRTVLFERLGAFVRAGEIVLPARCWGGLATY